MNKRKYKIHKINSGWFKKGTISHNRNRIDKNCKYCGKKYDVIFSRINESKYCSKKCADVDKIGKHCSLQSEFKKGKLTKDKHLCWKGGMTKRGKRVFLWICDKTERNETKYKARYRLVAEKILKRQLLSIEVIHHINNDESDDRPENLYLFKNQSYHLKFHRLKNKSQLVSNIINS